MIAGINGILEWTGVESVIVAVGGINLRLYVPIPTIERLGDIGGLVHLHTHLYVREDQLALYGFASLNELELFELLLNVSGIGPKVALGILSRAPADAVQLAIAQGDLDFLKKVPGIGVKTAQRIILDLQGKLVNVAKPSKPVSGLLPADYAAAQERLQVIEALTNLGYSTTEVQAALSALPANHKLSLEEQVLTALQHLAQA